MEIWKKVLHKVRDQQYPLSGKDLFGEYGDRKSMLVVTQDDYEKHIAVLYQEMKTKCRTEYEESLRRVRLEYFESPNGVKERELRAREMVIIEKERDLEKKAELLRKRETQLNQKMKSITEKL